MGQLQLGQPESVRREDVTAMLRRLGLDPMKITTGGVRITAGAITCDVFAETPDGKPIPDPDEPNAHATHRIHIAVVD